MGLQVHFSLFVKLMKVFNCFQTKFINYFSPVGLFYAIFCLTNFSSDPFDFLSSKRDKNVAPGGH